VAPANLLNVSGRSDGTLGQVAQTSQYRRVIGIYLRECYAATNFVELDFWGMSQKITCPITVNQAHAF
jgi:hypothetical protein